MIDEETNTRRQIIGLIPKRWIFNWKVSGAEGIRNSCQRQQQNTIAPRFGVLYTLDGTLRAKFQQWYPGMKSDGETKMAA